VVVTELLVSLRLELNRAQSLPLDFEEAREKVAHFGYGLRLQTVYYMIN